MSSSAYMTTTPSSTCMPTPPTCDTTTASSFTLPTPPTITATQSVFDLVRADHQHVETLYTAYQSTSDITQKHHLAQLIIRELSVHAVAEEQTWYQLLQTKLTVTGNQLHAHSMHEHDKMKSELSKLDSMTIVNREYDTQLNVVMREVRHHVAEEESKIIPPLEAHCTAEELVEMKKQWREMKEKVPTRPHPYAPTSSIGASIAAAILKPIDAMRDANLFDSEKNKRESEMAAKEDGLKANVGRSTTKFEQ